MRAPRSLAGPLLLVGILAAPPRLAQDGAGYVDLPFEREIALARSAAPAAVSAEADIWVLEEGRYRRAVSGTNGNGCMVSRTRPTSVEPICYDPEGARTLLPIEIRLVEERPSMTYMLSSGQRLVSDDGRDVGSWRPHFMMYIPYLRAEDIGLFDATSQVFVAKEGEPLAHVITVADEFIDPESGT